MFLVWIVLLGEWGYFLCFVKVNFKNWYDMCIGDIVLFYFLMWVDDVSVDNI